MNRMHFNIMAFPENFKSKYVKNNIDSRTICHFNNLNLNAANVLTVIFIVGFYSDRCVILQATNQNLTCALVSDRN